MTWKDKPNKSFPLLGGFWSEPTEIFSYSKRGRKFESCKLSGLQIETLRKGRKEKEKGKEGERGERREGRELQQQR